MPDDEPQQPQRELPTPNPNALIICEQIVFDQTRGKPTLISILTHLEAPAFPAVHPGLAIDLEMTRIHGAFELAVKIARVPADDPNEVVLVEARGQHAALSDPLEMVLHTLQFNGLTFDRPGEYRVVAEADEVPFIARRLTVGLVSP